MADLIDSTGAICAEAYWEIVEARTAYRARFVQSLAAGGVDTILCPPAEITAREVEEDSAGLPVGVQVVSRH